MLMRCRGPSLALPDDSSPEALLQSWALSARDLAEVMRCRGESNRRRFAVQLCTLRASGVFYGMTLTVNVPTFAAGTPY